MRITVIGIVAVIGTIVLLAFIAEHFIQSSKRNQNGDDEQPITPS